MMRLKAIDKSKYKVRFRVVFVAIVVALLAISVPTSTFIIAQFSTPEASHFWHNLAGVFFAAVVVISILKMLRSHPYMYEVMYVWDLKQELNRIHRKLRKIEARAEQGNHHALIVLNFMYRGSKQLYELDDNTITMDSLMPKLLAHEQKMKAAGLSTSTDEYDPAMLDQF